MMLEDKGAKVEEYQKNFRPGKLEKISTGNFIAYVAVHESKQCGIGKVLSIYRAEAVVIIHKYRLVSDCRLRLYWTPVYVENGMEVLGTGISRRFRADSSSEDSVASTIARRSLGACSGQTPRSFWLYLGGDTVPQDELAEEVSAPQQSKPRLPSPAAGAVTKEFPILLPSTIPKGPVIGDERESPASKVERFCQVGGALPSVGPEVTGHVVHFATALELRRWLSIGAVDFVEVFRGYGEATIKVREAGCSASDGFDERAITYERCWCLDTQTDQADFAWLITFVLRPKVVHLGTPCTKMCLIGSRDVDFATCMQNELKRKVALHQAAEGLGASIEPWMHPERLGRSIEVKDASLSSRIQERTILEGRCSKRTPGLLTLICRPWSCVVSTQQLSSLPATNTDMFVGE